MGMIVGEERVRRAAGPASTTTITILLHFSPSFASRIHYTAVILCKVI